jgi:hypothetical protein
MAPAVTVPAPNAWVAAIVSDTFAAPATISVAPAAARPSATALAPPPDLR